MNLGGVLSDEDRKLKAQFEAVEKLTRNRRELTRGLLGGKPLAPHPAYNRVGWVFVPSQRLTRVAAKRLPHGSSV